VRILIRNRTLAHKSKELDLNEEDDRRKKTMINIVMISDIQNQ